MPRTLSLTIAVVAAAGLLVAAAAIVQPPRTTGDGGATAHAEDAELAGDGVTVEAIGTVEGTPDVLTAQVGVQVEAASVDGAYGQANRAAAEVRDALLDRDVDDGDVQTAQLSVGPAARHRPGPPEEGDADGYVATTTLRVDLRDIERAGEILDAAVDAAGDAATLHSLGFGLDDDADLLVTAREAAFGEARAKAEQYAELADRSLGELTGLTEADRRGPGPPRPMAGRMALDDAEAAAVVEPGAEEVHVRVRARWALD